MQHEHSDVSRSLLSGIAGAMTLTAVHETARQVIPDAPRIDVLGRQVIGKSLDAMHIRRPGKQQLQELSLAGDLVSNSLAYSMVGCECPTSTMARGLAIGSMLGAATLLLPSVLGFGHEERGLSLKTKAMTFGWYVLGGIAAACTYNSLREVER